MIALSRRLSLLLVVVSISLTPACALKRHAVGVPDAGTSVSVDVEDLFREEAAKDPVIAYRVRLASDPDNAGLHNNLGNALVLRNSIHEAIAEFQTSIRLDAKTSIPWNNLGTAYKKIDKLSSARSALKKAIKIDGRYALAYYNLGTVYDAMGDYDKAIELYLKAVSLRPELADVKFNPQVVNNNNLMVVKLRHFLEESGNIALPLERLPE